MRKKQEDKPFYRRNLPHWQPDNAVLFMTARLDGSLPKSKIKELKEIMDLEIQALKKMGLSKEDLDRELKRNYDLYFGKFDKLLDGNKEGPHWLKDDKIAQVWIDSLNYFDKDRYQVICSTVMSNHVHFIFYKLTFSLAKTMHSLKSYSGTEANKILQRSKKKFWQQESFDRMIRNREELKFRINYVLNNAVEAGLVKHWKDWKYNYVHPDFLKFVD